MAPIACAPGNQILTKLSGFACLSRFQGCSFPWNLTFLIVLRKIIFSLFRFFLGEDMNDDLQALCILALEPGVKNLCWNPSGIVSSSGKVTWWVLLEEHWFRKQNHLNSSLFSSLKIVWLSLNYKLYNCLFLTRKMNIKILIKISGSLNPGAMKE